MNDILITPLMGLPNPVPSADPGPDYAKNIYNSLNILDGHNHSPGSGNQINTAAILINADLPFNSNYNITQLRSLRLEPQAAPISLPTDLGCLYESGVDLYYNDGNGNQVRITSGGSVNATSSGISSGTATASFSGGILVVDSNTNTPGNIQCGSVLIGNNTVGSDFVTLSAPNALAINYQLFLPAIPGSTSFVTLDSSGNFAATVATAGGIIGSNISSNINLPGKAVQENGNNVIVSNTNATNSLSIVRGSLTSAGGAAFGEGYSASGGTNPYSVTFSSSFGDTPVCVLTPDTIGVLLRIIAISSTGFTCEARTIGGAITTSGIFFICIGQRA